MKFAAFFAVALTATLANAQTQLQVYGENTQNRPLNVFAISGSLCYAFSNKQIIPVKPLRYEVAHNEEYSPGKLQLIWRKAHLRRDQFYFSMRANSPLYYEDCYIVFTFYTNNGELVLMPKEIGDIVPDDKNRVTLNFKIPYNIVSNRFDYTFHTQGLQIKHELLSQ